jgi:hypothetical protein
MCGETVTQNVVYVAQISGSDHDNDDDGKNKTFGVFRVVICNYNCCQAIQPSSACL